VKLTRTEIIKQERMSAAEFHREALAAKREGNLAREAEMSLAADIARAQADRVEGMGA